MSTAWIKMGCPNGIIPISYTASVAAAGFDRLGYDIQGYYGREDINLIPGDVVVGSVDFIDALMQEYHLDYHFTDYPKCLSTMYGRNIHKTKLSELSYEGRLFIKPVKAKQFVAAPRTQKDLELLKHQFGDVEVYAQDVLPEFTREWRLFIKDGRIVGQSLYIDKIDNYALNLEPEFLAMISSMLKADTDNMPACYSVDIGETTDGRLVVLECNDAYAIGSYTLDPTIYATFLKARFDQLFWNK